MSGLTDANTMQLFECHTEVHLCLCATCLYIAGIGVGGGVVYKRLCDPSHLNLMHLLLPFRLGQVLQSQP